MGRYILTGIIYKVQFSKNALENIKEEAFKKKFSQKLFDYNTFEEGFIQLSSNISGEVIAKLRSLIIDSLGVGYEKENEKDLYCRIVGSSTDELIYLAESRKYYTFLDYSRDWMVFLEDRSVLTTFHYFGIYATDMKFYPMNQGDHEIVRKMDRLIRLNASDECKPYTGLISSIITL